MFPVASPNYRQRPADPPTPAHLREIAAALDTFDDAALIKRLKQYRWTGRPGYPLRALWRAYVCSFLMNLSSTNALIRELQDNLDFQELCGFSALPHRTTFNRFIARLSGHSALVETVFAGLTDQLKTLLPDLGEEVAVDSTAVKAHCNPNKKPLSDPEASWTAKTSARAKKDGREWYWGYKDHMVADVNYGLPLGHICTTASRNDSPELPNVIAHTERLYQWFRPDVVIADKGYDAASNHEYLNDKGIVPIIHLRRAPKGGLYEGIYTNDGVPTCVGQVPMRYVRSDPVKGHLYRCVGCHLAKSYRGGIRHCDTEVWEDPKENIRLFGVVRRQSPEWKALYAKRQAIERVFKSMKESRRLERHNARGLHRVTLHCLMSALTFQATALVKLQRGEGDYMRWMVRRVA